MTALSLLVSTRGLAGIALIIALVQSIYFQDWDSARHAGYFAVACEGLFRLGQIQSLSAVGMLQLDERLSELTDDEQ